MRRLAIVIFFIYFASSFKDTASWTISIKPDAGHIRVNKSTRILCQTTEYIKDCLIKIDSRPALDFSSGANAIVHVTTDHGSHLYSARYAGKGLRNGECGVSLMNVAAGVYVVGCLMRNKVGSLRMEHMTLTVDDSHPLRVKVNRKYQVAAPGSEVAVLCSTELRTPLDHCALRLPSNNWVMFPKGHLSRETDRYHYHGRGLEKGHCGVNLVNVRQADSGLVLCHVKAGGKSAVRAAVIKVARPKPEIQISWAEKTHLAPADILDAECVMRGAYPLPEMVWTLDSKNINNSDIVKIYEDEKKFQWPWEDHVIRQKVSVPIGTNLGNKTLKCEAAESLDDPEESPTAKYIISDNNVIVVPVFPTCGKRTKSTYNSAFPRKPISKWPARTGARSRRSSPPKRSEEIASKSHAPANVSDALKSSPKTTTDPSPNTSTVGVDVDYEEPVWDETEIDAVILGNPSHIMDSSPAVGLAGAVSILSPDYDMIEATLPIQLRPKFPAMALSGGKSVLSVLAGSKSITDEKQPHTISAGGREVIKIPDLGEGIFNPPIILQSVGGIEVIPEVHYSAGGIMVFNKTDVEVEFLTYPWTAAVYKKIKGNYSQQCGGTLVTETHVICAAHCFWNERESKPIPPDDYMVALGKVFRDWDTVDALVQKRRVRRLHLHPVFRGRKRNFQHDISVIELDRGVVYSPRVAPACLDWDNDLQDGQLVNGNVGVVTGWGYTEDETPSKVLRYVELPYVDANTCYDKLPEEMQLLLTTDKFCAGFSNRNTSACPGDSGGGLVFLDPIYEVYFLRGIVSVSFRPPNFQGNCYYSEVTGFTLVSQSLTWLKGILNHP